MRRLLRRDVGPPIDADGDSFRYYHPETGRKTGAVDYYSWREKILAYRNGNGLPIPADLMRQAEDQLCGSLPPELCQYEEGDPAPLDIRIGLDDVKRWIGAVAGIMVSDYVEQSEAERRAAICVRCPYNVNVMGGCGYGCQKLVEFATPGMLARKTSQDGHLRSCAVCKCFNTVAVHFPLAVLEENDNPEFQEKFPAHCWKKRGGENYIAG